MNDAITQHLRRYLAGELTKDELNVELAKLWIPAKVAGDTLTILQLDAVFALTFPKEGSDLPIRLRKLLEVWNEDYPQ